MIDLPTAALRGSYVPLVTPFSSGDIDLEGYARLVEFQVSEGSHGVVVSGTTGEPSLLTSAERVALMRTAVNAASRRLDVVAATGCQSLPETLELTRAAEAAGADAVLVVTPYFVKPPQRGLIAYYEEVCHATRLPVLIYHIPGRAGVTMTPESVAAAATKAENLVGMKHASTDIGYITDVLHRLGPGFRIFAGLEELSYPMLTLGACGLMNAVGNLAPAAVSRLTGLVAAGDHAQARHLHEELAELNQAVFWDTNPIPIKYMMWRMGLLRSDEHRLPMAPPDRGLAERLDDLVERSPFLRREAA